MKRIIVGGLVILMVMALAGCSEQEDVIKIGVSMPGTGFFDTMGEYVVNGITLAEERLDLEGGPEVKLVVEDDRCDGLVGHKIARKLVDIDRVDYVIGPFCARVVSPTMEYYEEEKVVRMITGLGVDSFKNDGNYKFVLLSDVENMMVPLGEYAYDQGLRKIAVLHLDDDYGKENAIYFAKGFEDAGGEVLRTESFDYTGELDYRVQLIKMKAEDPDAVFIAGVSRQLINALTQMKELEINVPVFSLRNTEDTEVLREGGALLEGVIFPSITVPPTTEEGKWFEERYLEKYGDPHEVVAANAYDSFMILVDTIQKCNKEVECVRDTIASLEDFEGVSGEFSIGGNGVAIRKPVIKTIENGEFVTLS